MCGAHHMVKDKSAADCTRVCVKEGTKYAIVVGEKVYTREGHEERLDQQAQNHEYQTLVDIRRV